MTYEAFEREFDMNLRTKPSFVSTKRDGSASIELVLAGPLLILLMLVVFMIAAAGMTRWETSTKTRLDTFQHVGEWWDASAEHQIPLPDISRFDRLDDVLKFDPPFEPRGGTLVGEGETRLKYAPLDMARNIPDSVKESRLFTGVWDHRELVFEQEAEHPRLTSSKRLRNLAPGSQNNFAIDFRGLETIGTQIQVAQMPDFDELEDLTNSTESSGDNRKSDILENLIPGLLSEIAREESRRDPNEGRIRDLRAEVEDLREQVEMINNGLQAIGLSGF